MLTRPDGTPCPDINWDEHPQYASWMSTADTEPADRKRRQADVKRQGLAFAGKPHRCFDDENGNQLWAVALT